jgi:aspartate/methionine/tyrosine aminotransferase
MVNLEKFLSRFGNRIEFPHSRILAQSSQAKGAAINATIGVALNDDGSPMMLGSYAKLVQPQDTLYSPSQGQPKLRELWANHLLASHPNLRLENITKPIVVGGLTHGLDVVGRMFLNHNERILLPSDYWENYDLSFLHAERLHYNAHTKLGFDSLGIAKRFAQEQLPLYVDTNKLSVLLNFPNNPTGYTLTESEYAQLETSLCEEANNRQILAICDDAYFGLVYDETGISDSIFSRLSQAHDNILAVKVDGLSKEHFYWGGRVAFVTFGSKSMTPQDAKILEDKTAAFVRGSVSNVNTAAQFNAISVLSNYDSYVQERDTISQTLRSRYLATKNAIASNPQYEEQFSAMPFNSGYFMCVKLREGLDATDVRTKLLEQERIGTISVGKNMIRVAYSSVAQENIPRIFEGLFAVTKAM